MLKAGRALRFVTVFTAFTASGALAQSEDIYIPNTGVSYNISREHNGGNYNTSVVYVDEVNDTTNKTYVGFQCSEGVPYFFLSSKNPLVTPQMLKSEQYPKLTYQADGGAVRTLNALPWGQGEEFKPNLLLVEEEEDANMLKLFRNARSKVVLKVKRTGLSDLVFTFAVSGFERGFQAIKACR